MTTQLSNKKIKSLVVGGIPVINALLLSVPVWAQDYRCSTLNNPDAAPSPLALACLLARVLRIFIFSAGAVFVIIAAYGSWKIYLALGDPKALSGGKQTWTYGVYGFFVVVGFFALFTILTSALGIQTPLSPDAIIQGIVEAFAGFLGEAKITGY
jgi:hypothetical protein